MTENTKITKAIVLNSIKAYFEGADAETKVGDVTVADVNAYVDATIAQLEKKAASAKAKAAEKKAEGDELRAKVLAALTDEFKTREEIFEALDVAEDVTVAKVGARLTQLINTGEAIKAVAKFKVGDKTSKKIVYGLPTATIPEDDVE